LAKLFSFFAQTTASFRSNFIVTVVYEKNANFIAEKRQKSQKIEIITATPAQGKNKIYCF
jgi:hypothetical protein